MTPEEVHREKLKQLGYKDDYIEDLVLKYIASCTYEFAEAYHQEKVNSALVSVSQQRELLIAYHKWSGFTDDNGDLVDESEIDEFLSNL